MKKVLEFFAVLFRLMCPLPEDITQEQAEALALVDIRDNNHF